MHLRAKVKLGLFLLNTLGLIGFTKAVIKAMTGNPDFPDADPLLAVAQTALNNLETAKTDQDAKRKAAESATEVVHNRVLDLRDALRDLGGHVDAAAKGDAAIIEGAGMDSFLPGKAADSGPLARVTGLEALPGAGEGMVALSWNPLLGARSYRIQFRTSPEDRWTELDGSTASEFIASGLESGTKHWFRVAGLGSSGTGPFSDPATINVP